MPDEPRADLLAAKLRALVTEHWGPAERVPSTFPRGAALSGAGTGWVLAHGRPDRALGPALVWARKANVDELMVLVERDTGVAGDLARRAASFERSVAVWAIDGRTVERAEPTPPRSREDVPSAAAALASTLVSEGLEVVVEDGIVRGEVLGLEVVRVVEEAGEAFLEVGVGKHDREAQRLVHGDTPALDALRRAADQVRALRRHDAEPHPLNRLAAERWLRALVIAQPEVVGATRLDILPSTIARDDLRVAAPAAAGGAGVVAVCSVGVDLDLVPVAADARLTFGDDGADLVLVVPQRDDHPVTRELARGLRAPARVLAVPNDWRVSLTE
jgi:hypothetical protein